MILHAHDTLNLKPLKHHHGVSLNLLLLLQLLDLEFRGVLRNFLRYLEISKIPESITISPLLKVIVTLSMNCRNVTDITVIIITVLIEDAKEFVLLAITDEWQ